MDGERITIFFHGELVSTGDGVALKDRSAVFPEDMIQCVDWEHNAVCVIPVCVFIDERERWMVRWSNMFGTRIPACKIKDIVVEYTTYALG